jgi:hypothetical protein
VFGAVAVLIGYALMSFVGAARDRRRTQRDRSTKEAAADDHDKAEVAS